MYSVFREAGIDATLRKLYDRKPPSPLQSSVDSACVGDERWSGAEIDSLAESPLFSYFISVCTCLCFISLTSPISALIPMTASLEDGRGEDAGKAGERQIKLTRHTSRLPNFLYILSFAPPCPSLFRDPRGFLHHPHVLYSIGTVSSLVAGVGFPAWDILVSYFINGISTAGESASSIQSAGDRSAWLITLVGILFLLFFALSQTCRQYCCSISVAGIAELETISISCGYFIV